MQNLKCIESSHLTNSTLKILAQNRITTIVEFLQEDAAKITTLTKLSLHEVLTVRNEIFEKYSAKLENGIDLLDKFKNRPLSSGIPSLNAITGGGIPTEGITEICGLSGAGKTQLCLQLAMNCASNSDYAVLYVDTKGDFSATQVKKVLERTGWSHKEMARIMLKIRIVYIWNMDSIVELFKNIKNKTFVLENLKLIIVDSLPCLMLQHLGDNNKAGLTLLNVLVNYMRFLTREEGIAIVCVNIQTTWVEDVSELDEDDKETTSSIRDCSEKRNRCLGRYWQRIPVLLLLLDKLQSVDATDQSSLVAVRAIKTNSVRSEEKCTLKISDIGVS